MVDEWRAIIFQGFSHKLNWNGGPGPQIIVLDGRDIKKKNARKTKTLNEMKKEMKTSN